MQLRALFAGIVFMLARPVAIAEPPEVVVLLHGMGRTKVSMLRLASALESDGYRVANLSYPSRRVPVETLAADWLPRRLREHDVVAAPRVHFVTHSLGGILVRLWLRDALENLAVGRVVMLAPPNSGSELTDALHAFPPYRWVTGVNGRRLGTNADALPATLGPWPAASVELGVIAGDRSLNPLLAAWLPGPNDGKVTVAATHLAGERAHVVVHHSHTWLGWRRDTIAQTRAFLREGRFVPARA